MIDSAILIDFNAGSPESGEHAECIDAYEKHRATIVFSCGSPESGDMIVMIENMPVHLKAA